ncbi:hypothetical protein PENTCL1PPCAC_7181, partial [Pristionchus entomophagus]
DKNINQVRCINHGIIPIMKEDRIAMDVGESGEKTPYRPEHDFSEATQDLDQSSQQRSCGRLWHPEFAAISNDKIAQGELASQVFGCESIGRFVYQMDDGTKGIRVTNRG